MTGVVRSSGSMRGVDGGLRHTCSWTPEGGPRGLVFIAHGLAEHAARYDWFATRLASQGFVVHALDHRGHGRSPGRRADIVAFDGVVDDLGALLDGVSAASPSLPRFLFGHSMGGAIAFEWALRHPGRLAGLLLSAPLLALDSQLPRWRVALLRWLARVAPGVGAVTLPSDTLSRDPAVVRAYDADPLVYRGAIPARTVAELFAHVAGFLGRAPAMRTPVFVLHGTGDRLVPANQVRPVVAAIGSPDRTLKLYEGFYHEILNEPEREQVCDDILRWLGEHSASA